MEKKTALLHKETAQSFKSRELLMCKLSKKTGPGCSKPDCAKPGLTIILISVCNALVRCSVYIVCPSVITSSNLKLHQTLEVKNTFKQEKTILQKTFNPGLMLTCFRTTRPCRQLEQKKLSGLAGF